MKKMSVFFFVVPLLLISLAFISNKQKEETKGKNIFTASKCGTCHAVEAEGITSKGKGPDLSKLDDTLNTDQLSKYLKKQQTLHGKNHAIAFKGSDNDLKTLASWIAAMNTGKKNQGKKTSSSL